MERPLRGWPGVQKCHYLGCTAGRDGDKGLVFLSFPQGSPVVHSFCTTVNRFFIASRSNLPQSGLSEYVGNLNAFQDDVCGDAGGRLAILEGELPEDIRKRA